MSRAVPVSLAFLIGLAAGGAAATPLPAEPPIGPATVVHDTASGLDWLDVRLTRSLSTAAVSAALAPGGRFEGFRYATNAEFCALVGGAFAMPCDRVFGFTPLDVATTDAFIRRLGPTATAENSIVLRGLLYPRPEVGDIFAAGFFVNSAVPFAEADRQAVPFPRAASAEEGSFLVRPAAVASAGGAVPEPAPVALIGLALLGLGLMRGRGRLRRKI